MTTNQSNWESRFDEKFNKPIRNDIHKFINSAESSNIFLDFTKIKSFIRTLLKEQREDVCKEIEEELILEKRNIAINKELYTDLIHIDWALQIIKSKI